MSQKIARLNEILRTQLGEIGGKPRYQWMRSNELIFRVKTGTRVSQTESGLYFVAPEYRDAEILGGEPRWVLACFMEPASSREKWEALCGTEMEFPDKGFYFPTDIICRPGAEPDEDITAELISAIRFGGDLCAVDVLDRLNAKLESEQRDAERRIADEIENAMLAPDPAMNRVYSIPEG